MTEFMLHARDITKSFTLHEQRGVQLDVLQAAELTARANECVALAGPSGTGKSTSLKALYGNYRVNEGEILVRHLGSVIDLVRASAEQILAVRRITIGYVSQFLRVIPRIPSLELVAEPLIDRGIAPQEALMRAAELLERLNIPSRLQSLPPATFSGGEQQRINLARSLVCDWPILLLDEPTASLDAVNRAIVVELIGEAKAKGCAIIGIFHDPDMHGTVIDHVLQLQQINQKTQESPT